ncbi:MAG TPA: vanadium-dependent haloperoxidase [Polyangiaceae bacterium]|nr:vanadium-dependent haloperoxidase [Polyangiaceae bacterium]
MLNRSFSPAPRKRVHLSALGFGLVAALATSVAEANVVTDWSTRTGTVVNGQIDMEQTRSFAMVQIAIHDALNAIERRYEPYAYHGWAPKASPEAAVATAARDVLVAVVNPPNPAVDTWYEEALAAIPNGHAKRRGIDVGREAAKRIKALRAKDDLQGALTKPYEPGNEPGDYRVVPPFDVVVGAGWGELAPFVVPRATDFRPAPPFPLWSRQYTVEYQEVQAIGSKESTLRTPEQSQIADFWYESSATGWMRIANGVAKERDLNLWDSARALGLVSLALADGFINGFDAKYHYNYWRPFTAIREGDEDGNFRTKGDPNWTPYCDTPPVPDYPSTHSLLGAAAAEVLARVFGDKTSFTADSLSLPGVTRSYASFTQAAEENAASRVYCGIHWRHATKAGVKQGRQIGRYVVKHALRPKHRRHHH